MATIQVDHVYALKRAGFFTPLGNLVTLGQCRVHNADEITQIIDHGNYLCTFNSIDFVCTQKLETEYDIFYLLAWAFKDMKKQMKKRLELGSSLSHPTSSRAEDMWRLFLNEYGLLDEFESRDYYDNIAFYIVPNNEKIQLRNQAILDMDGKTYLIGDMDRDLHTSMIKRAEYHSHLTYNLKPLPHHTIIKNIHIMKRWDRKRVGSFLGHAFEIDWDYLSEIVPMSVIEVLPEDPWEIRVVSKRRDVTFNVMKRFSAYRWGLKEIDRTNIPVEIILSQMKLELGSRSHLAYREHSIVKYQYTCGRLRGIWRTAYFMTSSTKNKDRFWRHAAAGVIQRVWRRHRERLRRKAFATTFLGKPSYLSALPRDIWHMVYQYVRPASALRGLPPKFH